MALYRSRITITLTLRLPDSSIEREHICGDKRYKPPPIRKGKILAPISGILSNNTCFRRELDLYVGADKDSHVKAERLTMSYGVRTTEDLIEGLFKPAPSGATEQTPCTCYGLSNIALLSARKRGRHSHSTITTRRTRGTASGGRWIAA